MIGKVFPITSLLLFLSFSLFAQPHTLQAQQYFVGVPVNDTVFAGLYGSQDSCTDFDVSISLDSTMFPYVAGLSFTLEITDIVLQVPFPVDIYSQYGVLTVGDTFPFADPADFLNVYFYGAPGHIEFLFRATGVPQVLNETYPCHFTFMGTLAWCANGMVILPDDFMPTCSVDVSNNFSEVLSQDLFSVFPNPAREQLTVDISSIYSSVEGITIFNILGQTEMHLDKALLQPETTIDLRLCSAGIYYLILETSKAKVVRKILLK